MDIRKFAMEHIEAAKQMAMANYEEARTQVTELPEISELPELTGFAENGLGVAAFEGEKMLGFLCCCPPIENMFNSTAKGIFSPIHAHGAVATNRKKIYQKMYEAAASNWVDQHITCHALSLYAHDEEALQTMFTLGFGMRCVDAIRPMASLEISANKAYSYKPLAKAEEKEIRELRHQLIAHLGSSPCFMHATETQIEAKINAAEQSDTRVFVALDEDKPIAFLEIAEEAETFVTEHPDVMNICGAYCLLEYRGQGIYDNLMDYVIALLKEEGYGLLGVDFESINAAANGFWLKHFTAYTNSVVRLVL